MRFHTLALLTASSSILSNAAPFTPQLGELQRLRRRAVDYPVQSAAQAAAPLHQRRKRSVSYNVVQVDGEPANADANAESTATIIQTTTAPPCTETVVLTSTITGPSSEETIFITTTRVVDATVTATTPSSPPPPPPARKLQAQITGTVTATISTTATSSSSTSYYDDGLWHTYYPIKTPTPKRSDVPEAIDAREAFPIPAPALPPTREVGIIAKREAKASNAGEAVLDRAAVDQELPEQILVKRDAEAQPAPAADNKEALFDRAAIKQELTAQTLVKRNAEAEPVPEAKNEVEIVSWNVDDLTRREMQSLRRFMRS